MATFLVCQVFLLLSITSLVGADIETSVREFKTMKNDVFGKGYWRFEENSVEEKIHTMVRLIESGEIPIEVQGNQTLEYLKSLTNDCRKAEVCNLDEDLDRIERLSERDTGAPNLGFYLRVCQNKIIDSCISAIYQRANAKLSSMDEQTMRAIDIFAQQVDKEIHPEAFIYDGTELDTCAINHATVLRALKRLDPVSSKVMVKKWTNRRVELAKLMDKIRLPCVEFLENVDPIVTLLAPIYNSAAAGSWKVNNWHFYLNSCKKIVDDWKNIFNDAFFSYHCYLANLKPVGTSCFSG